MKSERIVITEAEMGIFIGVAEKLALFSKKGAFGYERATSFSELADAEAFVLNYLDPTGEQLKITYVTAVSYDGQSISIAELCRAGLADQLGDMMLYEPCYNKEAI